MRLSNKLNFFIDGKVLPFDNLVAASELAKFSVKVKYINNGLSLEPSCALSSPLIGGGVVFSLVHTLT
jgi:hypothetical protein